MRKLPYYLLLAIAPLATLRTMAQDLDFPDFRSKKDNFSKINDRSIRDDVASFVLAGVDESIGKAQLTSLPVKEVGSNFMSFDDGNIQVIIRTGVFFASKHKMMYQEKHLLRIDNHPYYGGIYGIAPQTTIESIIVVVGGDTVAIPANAYNDLFDPQFSYNQGGAARSRNGVFLASDKRNHTFYIYMLNVNGGGSEFTWVIRDKQYLRRVVDFGFMK